MRTTVLAGLRRSHRRLSAAGKFFFDPVAARFGGRERKGQHQHKGGLDLDDNPAEEGWTPHFPRLFKFGCAAGAFAALCACAISVGSKSKATGAADAAGAAFQATDGSDGPWQPASQFKEEAWMDDDAAPSAWGAPDAADTEDSWMPGPEMRGGAEDTAMAGSLGVLSAAGVPTGAWAAGHQQPQALGFDASDDSIFSTGPADLAAERSANPMGPLGPLSSDDDEPLAVQGGAEAAPQLQESLPVEEEPPPGVPMASDGRGVSQWSPRETAQAPSQAPMFAQGQHAAPIPAVDVSRPAFATNVAAMSGLLPLAPLPAGERTETTPNPQWEAVGGRGAFLGRAEPELHSADPMGRLPPHPMGPGVRAAGKRPRPQAAGVAYGDGGVAEVDAAAWPPAPAAHQMHADFGALAQPASGPGRARAPTAGPRQKRGKARRSPTAAAAMGAPALPNGGQMLRCEPAGGPPHGFQAAADEDPYSARTFLVFGHRWPDDLRSIRADRTRKFKCQWVGCNYESTGSGHMKRHMRTHTGERPYVCTWPGCAYSASQSGHLVQHMRSHTGERPFKCPVAGCDYAASRSGHLKRHMKVHERGDKTGRTNGAGAAGAAQPKPQ